MKLRKTPAFCIFLWCVLMLCSALASANSGIYHYSNDFAEAVQQNPLDLAYRLELKTCATTNDYGALEKKYTHLWHVELNAIFNKLLATKLTPEQKAALIDAQLGWLTWHTEETKFVNMTWLDNRINLGSQGPVQELKAQKYRLRERTLELLEYYCLQGGKVEFQYHLPDPAVQLGFDLMRDESLGLLRINRSGRVVLDSFGKPEEKTAPVNWGADGLEHQQWLYPANGVELGLVRNGTELKVDRILIKSPCGLKTRRGIGIGSTEDAVRAAYGKELNAALSGTDKLIAGSVYGGITFTLQNGVVTSIFIGASAE